MQLTQAAGELVAEGWSGLLTSFGTLGILMWFLWYKTSVSDPKRETKFCESIEAICEKFEASLRENRNELKASLARIEDRIVCSKCGGKCDE